VGLDPQTLVTLSVRLKRLAKNALPRLIVSLRPQDPVPDWMTHLLLLQKDCKVALQGEKKTVYQNLHRILFSKIGKKHDSSHQAIKKEYEPHAKEIGQILTSNGIQQLKDWRHQDDHISLSEKGHARDTDDDHNIIYESLTPKQKKDYDAAKVKYDQGSRAIAVLKTLGLYKPTSQVTPNKPKQEAATPPKPLIEMNGIRVSYGTKTVLGAFSTRISPDTIKPGLHLTIRRASRWGIFGSNGSGKTTLLSLLTSDHPQTYSLPITHFSRPRLHTPGSAPPLSLFELQARIGHSSPEIHAFFPRHLTVRQTLESAFAETFRGKPYLDHDRDLDVDSFLRWFEAELNPAFDASNLKPYKSYEGTGSHNPLRRYGDSRGPDTDWADHVILGSLPLSSQRVALFLRALVKRPDVVILDEALSGMDDFVRDKCLLFLQEGEGMAIHPVLPRQMKGETNKEVESRKRRNSKMPMGSVRRLASQRIAFKIKRSHNRFFGLEERQALVVVSHVKEEVPGCVREWVCLPDVEGNGLDVVDREETGVVRMGRLRTGLDVEPRGWDEIWGVK
jgi:ABC-type molybdenum transport system ATPase subunit/photorepair protein PhrA